MKKLIPVLAFACLFSAACIHFDLFPTLPEDVPTIPDARVLSRMYSENPPAKQWVLEIQGQPSELFNFYKAELQERGWAVRVQRQDFLALFSKKSGLMITTDPLPGGGTRATFFMAGI